MEARHSCSPPESPSDISRAGFSRKHSSHSLKQSLTCMRAPSRSQSSSQMCQQPQQGPRTEPRTRTPRSWRTRDLLPAGHRVPAPGGSGQLHPLQVTPGNAQPPYRRTAHLLLGCPRLLGGTVPGNSRISGVAPRHNHKREHSLPISPNPRSALHVLL